MLDYTYMDMEKQQAPRFNEYPEIYNLQNGKDGTELSLEEINIVLKSYGKFLAKEILKTGWTVNNWILGNGANFGFAGVNLGLKTAVNKILKKLLDSWDIFYPYPIQDDLKIIYGNIMPKYFLVLKKVF